MINLCTTLTTLLLTTTLAAQTASYNYVDQKKPYPNPSPALLTATNLPKVGTTFNLQVPESWRQRNGTGMDYVVATGISNPNINIPALGGFLFSSVDFLMPTASSSLGIPGQTTMSFKIPLLKSIVGLNFYQQILEVDAKTAAARLSRGGHGIIGS